MELLVLNVQLLETKITLKVTEYQVKIQKESLGLEKETSYAIGFCAPEEEPEIEND